MADTAVRRKPIDVDAMVAHLRACIDKEANYVATGKEDIPVSVADASAQWLTAVLCGGVPGARVERVDVVGGSDGSTSRRALKLSYNEAGRAAGLPERLFGKATPALENRLICGLSGAIFNERDFYNEIRPHLSIEAPVSHFSAADAETFRSISLFDDMTLTDTVFVDTSHYIDRAKAEDMMGLLASFHADLLESDLLARMPHLKTTLEFQQDVSAGIEFEERSNIGIDRAASVIPAHLVSKKHELWYEGLMPSLERNVSGPTTLTHSDVHIGNWYVTAQGRMGLTDWQCVARGQGIIDVSYALSSALTIEDRRAWERDLVRLYAERLRAGGVPTTEDEAWLGYRQQMFHAFYNWVYTIGFGEMQPSMQPDDISIVNIKRMAVALDDLDSLGAMKTAR
jgi:thiamine kinase-like enzyme